MGHGSPALHAGSGHVSDAPAVFHTEAGSDGIGGPESSFQRTG